MAITISASRTGAIVGLNEIASILSEQNQVLAITAESQEKLTKSFDSYLKMLQGQNLDDLQEERREKTRSVSPAVGALAGFSLSGLLEKLGDGKGILGSLLGFLKRLVPVALGLVFGDDLLRALKPKIEELVGGEISSDFMSTLMGAGSGGLLGFLFGGFKGGLFGLVLGALTSEGTRNKIADAFSNSITGELEANDWETWALSLSGAFAVLWGPKLLTKAITSFVAGRAGKEASEEVGKGLVKNIFKNPKVLAAMTLGMRGLVIGAIGYLALQGAKALVDYFRDKNFEMFDEAISKSDKVLDRYRETGDESVLKEGLEDLGRANTEARRMVEIGQGSGRFAEAQKALDETSLAMGIARGERGQVQLEALQRSAIEGGLSSAMDYAMARAYDIGRGNPDQGDFLQAALELGSSKAMSTASSDIKSAFGPNALNTSTALMERSQGVSATIESLDNYSSKPNGTAPVVMDNSQTDASTTVANSSPIVLPNGGATDFNDNKSKMFISGL